VRETWSESLRRGNPIRKNTKKKKNRENRNVQTEIPKITKTEEREQSRGKKRFENKYR